MELNANAGHILGNQLLKSKIIIAKLDAAEPILSVESELKGPVAEGIHFVNKSPVAQVAQGFTTDLKGDELCLELKHLPLSRAELPLKILPQLARLRQFTLLYWYKSTNTDRFLSV